MGDFKTPKGHLEINWPLTRGQSVFTFYLTILICPNYGKVLQLQWPECLWPLIYFGQIHFLSKGKPLFFYLFIKFSMLVRDQSDLTFYPKSSYLSFIYMATMEFWNHILKVSRSRNKIVMPKLLPENKRTNLFFSLDDSEILETWISISSFKYFRVVKIEKQIRSSVFWEKLRLNNFVSRSTDF